MFFLPFTGFLAQFGWPGRAWGSPGGTLEYTWGTQGAEELHFDQNRYPKGHPLGSLGGPLGFAGIPNASPQGSQMPPESL